MALLQLPIFHQQIKEVVNFDFTDLSANNPTSWLWDFGDGNTSTLQNPSHTYADANTYTVCLTVTNDLGTDFFCSNIEVELAPIALFVYSDLGDGVFDFEDLSFNNPTAWEWDFGDGGSSTEQNVTYTYTIPGDYTVCLTASNAIGSHVYCEDISVAIPPVADFTFTDDGNGAYSFTDASTLNPFSWDWDFDDGNTSTEQNPMHTYTGNGRL